MNADRDKSEQPESTCRHCGHVGDPADDHTCPCPFSDAECQAHAKPVQRTLVAAAIAAWEARGPTSLTVALMADALYGADGALAVERARVARGLALADGLDALASRERVTRDYPMIAAQIRGALAEPDPTEGGA